MLPHLLQHCLDQSARDLDHVAGTVLDGDRIGRTATEYAHATARLERHQAESAIVGVKYPRLPSASPENLAAARLTVPGALDSSAAGSERLSPGGSSAMSADIVRGGSGGRAAESEGSSEELEFAGRPSTVLRPEDIVGSH